MRNVKVIVILDASSETEDGKILQSFILHFYPIQSDEARIKADIVSCST